MRDKNEDRGKAAALDLVKSVRTPTSGNFNQAVKKNLKVKNKINPLLTQKYFACYSLAQTSQVQSKEYLFWVGDETELNLVSEMNLAIDYQLDKLNHENEENGEMNNQKAGHLADSHTEQFFISGPIENVNSLPVFKLLQIFKLQQYAKPLTELGYGFEIYKLCLLSDSSKSSLLNKLNLMPGHRARFTQFFEGICKVSIREEKTRSNQRIK